MSLTAKFEKGRVKFEGEGAVQFGYMKGTAKWCHILKPNEYGYFGVDLYGEEVEDHITEFEALRDEAYEAVVAAGKKAMKADVYKEDDEGNKFISFKLPAKNYDGEDNKIEIYDVTGAKVTDTWSQLVGNGSIIKIKYRAAPYYMASTKMVGISYRVYAIQVIKLVEYKGASDSGFGDESDGAAPFDTDGDDF